MIGFKPASKGQHNENSPREGERRLKCAHVLNRLTVAKQVDPRQSGRLDSTVALCEADHVCSMQCGEAKRIYK